MIPDGVRQERIGNDAQRFQQKKARFGRDRNKVKTTNLTFILNYQIAGGLVDVVQHKVHRDKHQGKRQCRQNETVLDGSVG